MDKYLVLSRIEPQHEPNKGAEREDIIAIRAPGEKGYVPTLTEKRVLLCAYVAMSKKKFLELRNSCRPQSTFAPIGDPPSDPAEMQAWMAAMEAERKKLPKFGLKINFNDLSGIDMGQLNNLTQVVEPVDIPKEKIIEKSGVAAEPL